MSPLEVLYGTQASLKGEPFEFSEWTHCTCGHIYRAANGTHGEELDVRVGTGRSMSDPYRAALSAILHATPADEYVGYITWQMDEIDLDASHVEDDLRLSSMAEVVSNLTVYQSEPGKRLPRALALVDRAIAMLEAEQRKAMLDVLAQATVVDEVESCEPVLA